MRQELQGINAITSRSSFRVRRLSKDYERLTDSSECMIRLRGIQVLLNRFDPDETATAFKYKQNRN